MTAAVVAAERVVTADGVLAPGAVTVVDDRITAVTAGVPAGTETRPGWLVPGFVDIHAHGGGGATVVGAGQEAVATFARTHLHHGTTTLVASLVSAHPDPLRRDVLALAELADDGIIAGTHLEGPWIAPTMRGAHDPTALREPDPDEVAGLLSAGRGTVVMVTVAPELEHGPDTIRRVADAGALPAIGHTAADQEQARLGMAAGAVVATHLFNQMPPIHHRVPGPIPSLLHDPRMHVELIVDGVHLSPTVVALVRQAVPPGRIVLVTDAMAAAGAADGEYLLGDLAVDVADGIARLAGSGALAGSTLTMDAAVRRAVRECGFSVEEAVRAAASTPARLLGRSDIGSLEPGRVADLVSLSEDLVVSQVWQRGAPVEVA